MKSLFVQLAPNGNYYVYRYVSNNEPEDQWIGIFYINSLGVGFDFATSPDFTAYHYRLSAFDLAELHQLSELMEHALRTNSVLERTHEQVIAHNFQLLEFLTTHKLVKSENGYFVRSLVDREKNVSLGEIFEPDGVQDIWVFYPHDSLLFLSAEDLVFIANALLAIKSGNKELIDKLCL